MAKQCVVVTGATGNQGRAVVDALMEHGGYSVRGLTRNVDGAASQALTAKGVGMVSGHLLDKDSLIKAFAGAYAVFGVTIPFLPEGEVMQGQNLVDACKANGVPLLVWSSLPSASLLSNDKYSLPHFDQKAEVDQYIKTVNQPAVILHTGTFVETVTNYGYLKADDSKPDDWHIYVPIVGPEALWPLTYCGADIGPAVVGIVDNWKNPVLKAELSMEPIILVSGYISGNEMAKTVHKVTGKTCDYVCLPEEMAPVFVRSAYSFANEGLYSYGDRDSSDILQNIGVKLHGFEDYVKDVVVPYMSR